MTFKSNREGYRRQMRLDKDFCEKIEEKYLPFGLDNLVPKSLDCEFKNKSKFIQGSHI